MQHMSDLGMALASWTITLAMVCPLYGDTKVSSRRGAAAADTSPEGGGDSSAPHPTENPESPLMLDLQGVGTDPAKIDFAKLPRVPSEHAVVSDVRERGGKWVHQHAYLVHHADRYWAMWSDGPGVPRVAPAKHRNVVPGHDQPGTRVSYATSEDGLNWSQPQDLTGPPRTEGFGWIARGFWVREGELLALASHFNAPGYTGKGLSLEAFRWDATRKEWTVLGTVKDDTLNNFPPKKLPDGNWMMTRRDQNGHVSVLVGGAKAFDQWEIQPLAKYGGEQKPEEPYWYVLPDGKGLVGLIRDNAGSKRLMRTFSTDNGKNWSPIIRTNFPDATSKFFALRTSQGSYALVSNANPRHRDPLTLAISEDGLTYRHLYYLVGGRHVDYPHMIEHDGSLLISFSSAKQTVEVLKVRLADINALLVADQTDASHPPQRPLPKAVNRALTRGPAYYVDPAQGDDANDGSIKSPWKTMQYGVRQLKPGDTLYLREGIYYETVYLTQSGAEDSPIVIAAYPGELPVLDGGLREFLESPDTSWAPVKDGSPGEYVSTKTYSRAADRQTPHQFLPGSWEPMWGREDERPLALGHFADSMIPLHGYRTVEDLRATNELQPKGKNEGAVYCGPGLWFNRRTNRIHVRLAHHKLAGLGDRAYRGETDPRKLPLVVAAGFGRDVLRINGIKHVRIEGLVLRGATGSPMIDVYGRRISSSTT